MIRVIWDDLDNGNFKNSYAYDRLQAKLAELNGGLDGGLIKEPLRDAGEVSQRSTKQEWAELMNKLPVYYNSQEEKDDPKLYAENVRRLMAHEDLA
uniref:Lysophospholipid acyltransferase LPEAT1 isoform X2 n=1 Tax=Tanacetum cinerariifolium TaxID=118510 RepID=A0A6L2M727_TANCI|nr:lysophospholipid acyltransferase LPEAT1 isoform X2 [Tanacetum cinerariifolium]